MVDKEEFRDVPGYEGLYKISNKGTVVSYVCSGKPSVRCHNVKDDGQHYIALSRDKHVKRLNVGKLVAEAFGLPNPHNYKFIYPKDGNNANLDIDNLEWRKRDGSPGHTPEAEAKRKATWEVSKANGVRRGEHLVQLRSHAVSAYDDEGWVASFKSLKIAAQMTGAASIGQALAKGCRSGGYYWRYAEDE